MLWTPGECSSQGVPKERPSAQLLSPIFVLLMVVSFLQTTEERRGHTVEIMEIEDDDRRPFVLFCPLILDLAARCPISAPNVRGCGT